MHNDDNRKSPSLNGMGHFFVGSGVIQLDLCEFGFCSRKVFLKIGDYIRGGGTLYSPTGNILCGYSYYRQYISRIFPLNGLLFPEKSVLFPVRGITSSVYSDYGE